MNPDIDFQHFPCSSRGSLLALTLEEGGRIGLRDARIRFERNLVWLIELVTAEPVVEWAATLLPGVLELRGGGGHARFVVGPGPDDLWFEAHNMDMVLRLTVSHFGYGMRRAGTKVFKIHSSTAENSTLVALDRGEGRLDGPPETLPMGGGITRPRDSDLFLSRVDGVLSGRLQMGYEEGLLPAACSHGQAEEAVLGSWERFSQGFPVPSDSIHAKLCGRAIYTLWSSLVPPGPVFPTEACLMSKEFMTAVWSWDHCFNAMALSLSPALRQEAAEQFLLPFHFQNRSGCLPNCVGAALAPTWGVSKSPVHGMAAEFLRGRGVFRPDDVRALYEHLAAWSRFYLQDRDLDGNGLPEVPMGCDDWDNGSVFLPSFFVETAAHAAFLVRQLEVVADLERACGAGDGVHWQTAAERTLAALRVTRDGEGNFVPRSATGRPMPPSTSLNPLQVLALGRRLNMRERRPVIEALKQRFAGPFGPASEERMSPLYGEDEYWLGPVWAPTAWLIAAGLEDAGEFEVASEIARSFLLGLDVSGGMYETHSFENGRGLRARAYTWTAAVALLFVDQLQRLSR